MSRKKNRRSQSHPDIQAFDLQSTGTPRSDEDIALSFRDHVLLTVLPLPVIEKYYPHLLVLFKIPSDAIPDVLDSPVDGHDSSSDPVGITPGGSRDVWVAKWQPDSVDLASSPSFGLTLTSVWSAPKEFAHPQSNEDALAFIPSESRAAVFDGATESFAARRWARLLAKTWSVDPASFLDAALAKYDNHGNTIGTGTGTGTGMGLDTELSWMHSAAAQRGSFATIAAVRAVQGGLVGTVVGDSCIFLVNGTHITDSFPYVTSEEFTSAPDALATSRDTWENTCIAARVGTWNIPLSDNTCSTVVLATDAVAAWLLTPEPAIRMSRMEQVLTITTPAEWEDLVKYERSTRAMHVDDSTIMILSLNTVNDNSGLSS
jgi:hypothetical protein